MTSHDKILPMLFHDCGNPRVQINVIRVTRGGWNFPGKNRSVTLEWPLTPYLHNERGGVGFDVVIATDAREDLVSETEGGVLRRDVRANLSHDLEQCDLT